MMAAEKALPAREFLSLQRRNSVPARLRFASYFDGPGLQH
jgi:hypothetical protein